MPTLQKITPCLWFDKEGEDAARYYCGIFGNSKINAVTHYTEQALARHGRAAARLENSEQVHAALRPNRRLRKGFFSDGMAIGRVSPARRRAASR